MISKLSNCLRPERGVKPVIAPARPHHQAQCIIAPLPGASGPLETAGGKFGPGLLFQFAAQFAGSHGAGLDGGRPDGCFRGGKPVDRHRDVECGDCPYRSNP